jgi:hypothetical protein
MTPELERQCLIIAQSKGKEKSLVWGAAFEAARIAKLHSDIRFHFALKQEMRQIQENHGLRAPWRKHASFENESRFRGRANYGVLGPSKLANHETNWWDFSY